MLAAFHGPSEVGLRDELVDRATLKVTHRPLEGIGGERGRKHVGTTLTPFFFHSAPQLHHQNPSRPLSRPSTNPCCPSTPTHVPSSK